MPAAASPEARLAKLGLALPALRPAAGAYAGYVQSGALLFLSGQGADGWVGRVGADLTIEQGALAARDCALNLLSQTKAALGSLEHVARVIKVLGFIACTPEFTALPTVLNGASELLIAVFGDRGRHARSAVGMQALPLGFAVEVEMVVEVSE